MEGETQESENEHKENTADDKIDEKKVEKPVDNNLEAEFVQEKEETYLSEVVENNDLHMLSEDLKNDLLVVELKKKESLCISGDKNAYCDDNRMNTDMAQHDDSSNSAVVPAKVSIKSQNPEFFKPQPSSPSLSETTEDSSSSDEENTSCDFSDTEVITHNRLGPNKKPPMKKDPLELDNLPPIENLQISVKEEECMPMGKVFSIVDRLLVIESFADTPALMLDTVLFNRDGQPLGQIYDVFGHIKKPFYSVRFNKNEDIVNAGLEVEKVIYCAPKTEHTKYIFTSQLLKEKGSDASWINNEEPPPQCLDYSDDEQEKQAKQKFSNKKKNDEDEVVLVKVEQGDSPARKRYLSFEEQMNRNNTLRTKAFKRAASSNEKAWDGGWHNYKRNFNSRTTPLPDKNREYSFVSGTTYRASSPGNHQWLKKQFSQQPNKTRMRSQPIFQFGGSPSFTQLPLSQNFPRLGYRPQGLQGACSLGPSSQGFQSRQSPPQMFPQVLTTQSYRPVNTYPLNPGSQPHQQNFQPSHSDQGFTTLNQGPSQPVFRASGPSSSRPRQFPPFPQQNYQSPHFQGSTAQSYQSINQTPKVPSFQNVSPGGHPSQAFHPSSILQPTDNQGQTSFQPSSQPLSTNCSNFTQNRPQQVPPHCKCFQSNHRPPPVQNQGNSVQHYQPRIPFIPGFVSSPPPPPMQFRPNSSSFNVTSPPPPSFPSFTTHQQFPVQFQFLGNGSPPFRNPPTFQNAPLPPPP